MIAPQAVIRTAHGTVLAVDAATSVLRHDADAADPLQVLGFRLAVPDLAAADVALLARRDGVPLRFRADDPARPELRVALVTEADPARVALRVSDGPFLTATPDGGILFERDAVAGWELFAFEPDGGARAPLAETLATADGVAVLLASLPAARRSAVLAGLADRPDHPALFAAVRRAIAGGASERSEWHAPDRLRAGIDAHGWTVGDHSYGAPSVTDGEYGPLAIGRYCQIAGNVQLIVANHAIDRVTTYPFAALNRIWPSAPADGSDHAGDGIVIGNDVWIGQGAVILPGARIGDGAIVGAAAVVASTVPPYAVVVGNPARVIRHRFDEDTVARLLALRWWDWPDATVDRFIPFLLGDDVRGFLARAEAGTRRGNAADASGADENAFPELA